VTPFQGLARIGSVTQGYARSSLHPGLVHDGPSALSLRALNLAPFRPDPQFPSPVRTYMRIVGYSLLVLGFLWLTIWCAGSVIPLTRSIGIENFEKYSQSKTYSYEEVCDAMRNVLTEYQDNAHGIVIPAVLMLLGGILLDRAGRRPARRG
jgi:hypothetical protein